MTVQNILTKYEAKPDNLLRVIKEIQKEFGVVGKESIREISQYFSMKPAAVYSAASFYDQIDTEERFDLVIKVCDGANCNTKNAEGIIAEVENFFGQKVDDTFNHKVKIRRESCFGLCAQGPIMVVNNVVFEKVTPQRVDEILRSYMGG